MVSQTFAQAIPLTSGEIYLSYIRKMDILMDDCFDDLPHYSRINAIKWVKPDLLQRGMKGYYEGQYVEVKVPGTPGIYTLKVTQVDNELELITLEPYSYVR